MNEALEVVPAAPQAVAIPDAAPEMSASVVLRMAERAIERGITPESVAAVRELIGLCKDMKTMENEAAFNAAFVQLQSELPVIVAKTVILNRGKYEKFEDIMHAIGPILGRNGFSVSFSQQSESGRVTATCHLRHVKGHATATPYTVRVGSKADAKSDTETQSDCKATTTAKRNSLIVAVNLPIRQDILASDEDARNEGGAITADQAQSLRERVRQTASDEAAFLRFAGVSAFESIPTSKFAMLDQALRRKENTR